MANREGDKGNQWVGKMWIVYFPIGEKPVFPSFGTNSELAEYMLKSLEHKPRDVRIGLEEFLEEVRAGKHRGWKVEKIQMQPPKPEPIELDVTTGRELIEALIAAGCIAPTVQRIIIDAHCDQPLTIYVQHLGGRKVADVVMDSMMTIIEDMADKECDDVSAPLKPGDLVSPPHVIN